MAVIRTSGPGAHRAAERLCGALPAPRYASLRAVRHPVTGELLDEALVLRFDHPATATGEDIVEYQCHGGRAVVDAVLDALTSLKGVRLAEPGEFTRRALASGRIDLTEAEGLADLLEAETEQQRRNALALAGGALSRQVDHWQAQILSLSARAEAAIDFVGDEDETATDVGVLVGEARALGAELSQWVAYPRAEPLKEGIRIVVAGPPNAGKSSLINALVGIDRAIVTPIPGTTRDTIEVPLAIDGIPLVLIDTAGVRNTKDTVEAIGVSRAWSEVKRAEILVWLGSPSDLPQHPDAIIVLSKADLLPDNGEQANCDVAVSAKTGANLPLLIRKLTDKAKVLLPVDTQLAINRRHAEAIESAARLLRSPPFELVLLAETLRSTRVLFDRLTGRSGTEDVINALFNRFCLGK